MDKNIIKLKGVGNLPTPFKYLLKRKVHSGISLYAIFKKTF